MAKKLNLLAGLSNAKTRTFVILFGTVIAAGIAIAVMRSGNNSATDTLAQQGSQTVAVPSSIRSTPGSVVPEKYRELQQAENERRAQEALQKKTSAIPTIIGAIANDSGTGDNPEALLNDALKGPKLEAGANLQPGETGEGGFAGGGVFGKTAADKAREEQEAKIQAQKAKLEQDRLAKERAEQAERDRLAAEARERERLAQAQADVQKLANQMKAYAGGAYTEWNRITPQAYVRGELAEKEYKTLETTTTETATQTNVTAQAAHKITRAGSPSSQLRIPRQKFFVKAGTVLFGVLDTSVNSDEPGPILATVVSGKYAGSKLIGNFTHQPQQESVIINFTQMSIPKYTKSFSVQAVAIDPNTARTALASDVDKHYLLRYGSLFASSFISGYGKAIASQGTTTTSPLTGATTTTTPPLSNKDKLFEAIGEVGTQWGQQTRPLFNTPYTVTVDQGTSVGLLFLADLELSSDLQVQGEVKND